MAARRALEWIRMLEDPNAFLDMKYQKMRKHSSMAYVVGPDQST